MDTVILVPSREMAPQRMRYTEARLQKITQEAYLADLDKDVVNFVPNFDETEKEPEVLLSKFQTCF